jgi:hypothetical protein
MKDSEDEIIVDEVTICSELEKFRKKPFVLQCKLALNDAKSKHKFLRTLYRIFQSLFKFFKELFDAKCSEKEIAKKIQEDKDRAKEILDMNHLLHSNFSGEYIADFFRDYILLYKKLLTYCYFFSKDKNSSQKKNFIIRECFPLRFCICYSQEKFQKKVMILKKKVMILQKKGDDSQEKVDDSTKKDKLLTYLRCCLQREIGKEDPQNMVKRKGKSSKIETLFKISAKNLLRSQSSRVIDALNSVKYYIIADKKKSEIEEILKESFQFPPEVIEALLNFYFEQTISDKELNQIMHDDTIQDRTISKETSKNDIDTLKSRVIDAFKAVIPYILASKEKSEIEEILKESYQFSPEMIETLLNFGFKHLYYRIDISNKKLTQIMPRYFLHDVSLQDDDDDNQNALDNIPDDSCITPQDKMIAKESLKNFVDTFMKVYNKFSEKELKCLVDLKLMGLLSNTIPFEELKHQSFYNKEGYQFVIASIKKGSIYNKDIAAYCKTNEVKVDRTINKFYYALVCNMKKNNLPCLNCVVLENQGQEKEYIKYLQKNNSTQKVITITQHVPVIEKLIQESFRDYYGLIA